MSMRNEFESAYKLAFPGQKIDRDTEGEYINIGAKIAWKVWQTASQTPEPVVLDEDMTDEFKLAWKNGLSLSSAEAKWAFVGWQSARQAPASGEVESVGDPDGLLQCSDPDCARFYDEESKQMACSAVCGGRCAMDNTHPQSAQQGSGPEGISETEWVGYQQRSEAWLRLTELLDKVAPEWRLLDGTGSESALEMIKRLATTPQPQGDGWIKCSDRLPAETDTDYLGQIWIFEPHMDYPVIWSLDVVLKCVKEFENFDFKWTPTGLKRPQPPVEQ